MPTACGAVDVVVPHGVVLDMSGCAPARRSAALPAAA